MLLIIGLMAETRECQLPSSRAAPEQNANSQVTHKWAHIDGALGKKETWPPIVDRVSGTEFLLDRPHGSRRLPASSREPACECLQDRKQTWCSSCNLIRLHSFDIMDQEGSPSSLRFKIRQGEPLLSHWTLETAAEENLQRCKYCFPFFSTSQ